jgi:hypothetical protein
MVCRRCHGSTFADELSSPGKRLRIGWICGGAGIRAGVKEHDGLEVVMCRTCTMTSRVRPARCVSTVGSATIVTGLFPKL